MKFETSEQRVAVVAKIFEIFSGDRVSIRRAYIREDNHVFVELMSTLMVTGRQQNYDFGTDEVPEELHVATYEQIDALAKLLPGHQIVLVPCTATSHDYPTLSIVALPK